MIVLLVMQPITSLMVMRATILLTIRWSQTTSRSRLAKRVVLQVPPQVMIHFSQLKTLQAVTAMTLLRAHQMLMSSQAEVGMMLSRAYLVMMFFGAKSVMIRLRAATEMMFCAAVMTSVSTAWFSAQVQSRER